MFISLSELDFEKVVSMSKFYVNENEKKYFVKFLNDKINLLQKTFDKVALEDNYVYPKEKFFQCFSSNDKVKNEIQINNSEETLLDKRKTYSFFIKNI